MMILLSFQRADIAVGMLGMTEERMKYVDYTPVFRQTDLAFLISTSSQQMSSAFTQLTQPFSTYVWWAFGGTLFAWILTWVAYHNKYISQLRRKKPSSLWHSWIHIFAMLYKQSKISLFPNFIHMVICM